MSGRTAAVGPSPFETRFALLRVTDPNSHDSLRLLRVRSRSSASSWAEQMAEHLEPVALRQFDQFDNSFGDEGHGLVRAALPISFFGWRSPIPARSAAASLAQKICIQLHIVLPRNSPFRAQL
jgi:hypothetical protein